MQRGVSIVKDTQETSVMGAYCGRVTGARLGRLSDCPRARREEKETEKKGRTMG